jgi:hypothetical protein
MRDDFTRRERAGAALQWRVSFIPSGGPFVGVRHLKPRGLLEGRRGNLHADWQTRRRETAANAYRRESGHVERYGAAGQKVSRSIL